LPLPRAASLAELNARLAEADAAQDARHVAGRAAAVGRDFAAERDLLLPLPAEPFATAAVLWPRMARYARISVPRTAGRSTRMWAGTLAYQTAAIRAGGFAR